MTADSIFTQMCVLELEVTQLHQVYWQYKAGMKTEQDLIIAYNQFRSRLSTTFIGED